MPKNRSGWNPVVLTWAPHRNPFRVRTSKSKHNQANVPQDETHREWTTKAPGVCALNQCYHTEDPNTLWVYTFLLLNPESVFPSCSTMSFPNTRHPPHHHHHHHSRWRWAEEAAMRSSSVILFDSTVVHGLGFTHSLAGDFEGGSLVGCDTLRICAQIRLDLLPHLLLGVQLFVWFTCAKANRTHPKLRFTTIIYDWLCFINSQGRNALTTYVLLYVHIVAQSHGQLFCVYIPACRLYHLHKLKAGKRCAQMSRGYFLTIVSGQVYFDHKGG